MMYPNNYYNPNVIILNNEYNSYNPGLGLAATNGFLTGILLGELIDEC